MKGISLLSISMLLILCASSEAFDYSYVPLRYRIRWSPYKQGLVSGLVHYSPYNLKYGSDGLVSERVKYSPYAFEYGSDGLVCDNLRYSPYAFKYGSSGLVNRNVRYTPYAFGYNKSGLVSDASSTCCNMYSQNPVINVITDGWPCYVCAESYEIESFSEYAERTSAEINEARKNKIEEQKARIKKIEQEKANDPSEAISQVLKSKNIPYRANRYLRIDGKTISVNFDIEDANIIIKFWNSKEIADFAKNDNYKDRIYENYLESWEEYYLNNIGNTKKVYNIIAGSKEEVFEMLAFNENRNANDTLYAIAQNRSSISQ